jgi:type VI secretion system secreted protein VgrG
MVIGSVYNGDQMPPYLGEGLDSKHKHDPKLAGVKSCSTKGAQGYNELRFDDTKGKEEIFIHAERNMDVRVKNDSMERIIGNRHQIIGWEKDGKKGGDQREMVYQDKHLKVNRNQVELIGGDMQLTIGGIDGPGNQDIVIKANKKETIDADSHLCVKGKRNQMIDGDQSLTVGGSQQERVGNKHALETGQEIHLKAGMKVIIEAGVQLTIKGPGGFVDIGPTGVTIQGIMVLINSGGAAGSGSGSSPAGPELPKEADPTKPAIADDSRSGYKSSPS